MEEGTIAYKVVRPASRASCVINSDIYQKIYSCGSIIKAHPETLGIFCFETYEAAVSWINLGINNWVVIKVRGIGEGIKIKKMIRYAFVDDELPIFSYKHALNMYSTDVPYGTICFKSVEVLE